MSEIARIGLLPELPEKPEGWTRKMQMHLKFQDGGAATFDIFDPQGEKALFGYQYDTRPGGLTGYVLPGIKEVMTWRQLRNAWPEWIKTRGRA
jgi:hypothetical protein